MNALIEKAVQDIRKAKKLAVLTGAGISVESGIPPFRGKGGVWEKFDPMEYAHIDAFMQNPAKVWSVLLKEMKAVVDQARPNDAHLGLAELENKGKKVSIITQNVDGLHQAAGSTDIIEFHGNFAWHHCLNCRRRYASRQIDLATMPPRCNCGGILRPECVFFGEMIPPDLLLRSRQVSSQCDIMLVIGTSAVVQPAAWMPVIAKTAGAKVIEINSEATPLTQEVSDYFIQGQAGKVVREIVAQI